MRVRVSYWNTEDEDKDGGRLKKKKTPPKGGGSFLSRISVALCRLHGGFQQMVFVEGRSIDMVFDKIHAAENGCGDNKNADFHLHSPVVA